MTITNRHFDSKRKIKMTDSSNEPVNVMSLPDGQKIPADGLFMYSVCTVTMTSFLLSGFQPEQR